MNRLRHSVTAHVADVHRTRSPTGVIARPTCPDRPRPASPMLWPRGSAWNRWRRPGRRRPIYSGGIGLFFANPTSTSPGRTAARRRNSRTVPRTRSAASAFPTL